jgi:PAS domain S-box-containing protein
MKPAVIWTEERKLFRSVTETTSLIAWATDESGQCYYLSPAWYQFTGAKDGEGLGFNWLTSVHPNDVVSVRRAFFEANDNRTAIGSAFRMADANGDYFLVWDVGLPKFSGSARKGGDTRAVAEIDLPRPDPARARNPEAYLLWQHDRKCRRHAADHWADRRYARDQCWPKAR